MNLYLKRIYDAVQKEDGYRILVDRLWPRGMTKERASIDFWLKDIAPTTELRKWFNHEPQKWTEFQKRYKTELKGNKSAISFLSEKIKSGKTTLLYAAKDEEHNEASVIAAYFSSMT